MTMAVCADRSSEFTKSYFYELSATGESGTSPLQLRVYFDNSREHGRPLEDDLYCTFDLSRATVGRTVRSTEHLCLADQYIGELTLESPSSWRLQYDVIGPKKDYVIDTRFVLAGPGQLTE
eukprot:gnl/TRDRNA2_/TRDRNA2_144489_c0_seq3.p1 gnl/TRDRNA2_/TRDRNA2_144489_c0~~gnl/TRDRNA2_/TRDRNA2_144489_c0_seq3.p1  ORF type:complete len:121 (+),score=11.11 gnl/TRDRNA2_/TRDRNA2_144489_c0_seq3:270-632(+)